MGSFTSDRTVRWLLLVLLVTFLVRAASVLIVYHNDVVRGHALHSFRPDSYGYDGIARAIERTGRFAPDPDHKNVPETLRTPGYPAFIAVFYWLLGERPWVALLGQIAVSVATIQLTYMLARRLWSPATGLAAAVLLALDVNSFYYSQHLLTETLCTFFVLLTVVAWFGWTSRPNCLWRAAGLGVALALATLIRPLTLYVIWFLAAAMGIHAWRLRLGVARTASAVVVLLTPWILLVGGWQLRNYERSGSWKLTHIDSVNLLMYRAAGIIALQQGLKLEQAQAIVRDALPEMRDWPEAKRYDLMAARGMATIIAHPLLHLRLQLTGLRKEILSSGVIDLWGYFAEPLDHGPFDDLRLLPTPQFWKTWVVGDPLGLVLFLLADGFMALFYVCMLNGLVRLWRADAARRYQHLCVLLLLVYLFVVPAGPEAYWRFRVPMTPLLALYAGYGLVALARTNGRVRRALNLAPSGP